MLLPGTQATVSLAKAASKDNVFDPTARSATWSYSVTVEVLWICDNKGKDLAHRARSNWHRAD